MNPKVLRFLIALLFAIGLYLVLTFMSGCENPQGYERNYGPPPSRLAPQEDLTVNRVMHFDGEKKEDSIKRWLWNLMLDDRIGYRYQLEAARLWLLLERKIDCEALATGIGNE